MRRTFCLALAVLLSALLCPAASLADDWEACMARPAPKFFYVADKSRKLLFQMEEKNGKLQRGKTGLGGRITRPGYPQEYLKQIVEQTGDKYLVPQSK